MITVEDYIRWGITQEQSSEDCPEGTYFDGKCKVCKPYNPVV